MKNFGIFRRILSWASPDLGFRGRRLKAKVPDSLAYETRQDMHEGADRSPWAEPLEGKGEPATESTVYLLFIYYAANTKL